MDKRHWVREHLGRLDFPESKGPVGARSHELRELVDTMARPLMIISERSWG